MVSAPSADLGSRKYMYIIITKNFAVQSTWVQGAGHHAMRLFQVHRRLQGPTHRGLCVKNMRARVSLPMSGPNLPSVRRARLALLELWCSHYASS